MSHPVNLFDGEAMYADFTQETWQSVQRLTAAGIRVKAIAVASDLWPERIFMHAPGYPVIRTEPGRDVPWGVIT